ncbi:MAG TPA: hypothetical protein VM487_10090 [Phycisphaerae bacterium]|nr:hypothetical protein [Phycisphaerae bacterium]
MQQFFIQHGEIVASFVALLLVLIVTLASALARVQFKHIREHQSRQDFRLGELEINMGNLKGDSVRTSEQVSSLSVTLEHYFEELKEDIQETRKEIRVYRAENERDHAKLVSMLKRSAEEGV